ncbi:hypothetical protein BGZ96_006506 [Linnemannia gamsii]|uniref:BTB domain-containing protein n=1 Tax=Linnemannia gamsii TaxID=64522 RepID=A0ABQ7K2N5_9FUNG|nr:hypothetical protein BGZ96_006506 [Linnemannia gamsii]
MAPLGSVFPRLFGGFGGSGSGYLKSIDAIFDDPVSTDVVFIWRNKVMMVVVGDNDSDSDSDSDDVGDRGERQKHYGVTLSRLYAHQAVLHQYLYFRRKLPLPSSSSSSCVMMLRKLLMKDFSLPVFRVVLRWLYTRTLDITEIFDAQTAPPNKQPTTSSNSNAKQQQQDDEARVTWTEIYQIADNLELAELRTLAKNKMRQT